MIADVAMEAGKESIAGPHIELGKEREAVLGEAARVARGREHADRDDADRVAEGAGGHGGGAGDVGGQARGAEAEGRGGIDVEPAPACAEAAAELGAAEARVRAE